MIIKNVWYESDQWSNEYSIDDVNSDVMFELSDGTKWSAFSLHTKICSVFQRRIKKQANALRDSIFMQTNRFLFPK